MDIVYFTVITDKQFAQITLKHFAMVNDYPFVFYVYTHDSDLQLDNRFVIRNMADLKTSKYKLNYDKPYIALFKFFEFSKQYNDAFVCYIADTVLCMKSLLPVLQQCSFGEKTNARFSDGTILYGVKDIQNCGTDNGYRLYARKCLSIRSENYLSSSVLISKGFHIYRHEFQDFIDMCPRDLINPEMDFINWYFKNKIAFLDNVCINYTNYDCKDFYAYDYNTDIKPISIPVDYIKYVEYDVLCKILDDFKFFKTALRNCNETCYNSTIKANEEFIKNVLRDMTEKQTFIRRYVLKCGD